MKKLLVIVFFLLFINCVHATNKNFVGQRFILTLPENSDNAYLQAWLAKTKPAGVMLLASHFRQKAQAKAMIDFLQQEARKLDIPPLLIAVDWEGGIVSRPNETGGFISVPSPWSLAQAGRPACFLGGMLIGQQLREIGANVDFAPSLDLFNKDNQILATRCFAQSPVQTAEYGIAFAKGLMTQGVLPVIKHFPGLGLGSGDTHHRDVVIQADATTFKHHVHPFAKALSAGIPCVMATHASFKQFGKKPVTLNARAVAYLKSKNPDTLLITDDFCMKAVLYHDDVMQNFIDALDAGYHTIIYSGRPSEQIDMLEKLEKRYAGIGPRGRKKFDDACAFIAAFKEKHCGKNSVTLNLNPDIKAASHWLAQRCIEASNTEIKPINKPVVLISVDLPKIRTSEPWFIHSGKTHFCSLLSKNGIQVDEFILDPRKTDSIEQVNDVLALYEKSADKHFILQAFFYGDTSANTIQREWIAALEPVWNRLAIISLGHPSEDLLAPSAQHVTLGSFHKPMLEQAAAMLCTNKQQAGADRFVHDMEKKLRNKRFALLCHRCSTVWHANKRQFLPDVLKQWADSCKDKTRLVALASPEHGLLGTAEAAASVASSSKSTWGCPVYSLHSTHKKPTAAMLKNVDVLIIDLQDIGVRCFTYLSTLKLAMQAAAEHNIEVIVLDRPNPLLMWKSDGPKLEKGFESFVGKTDVPFLYGTTIGAFAREVNKSIGAKLTVVDGDKHSASMMYPFIPPSPNLMSIDHVFAYPLTVFLEGTNYSEGRGTAYPFLQIGAPWVDEQLVSDALNSKKLPGVYFEPITFTPRPLPGIAQSPKHKDVCCHGVFIHIFDHACVQPMRTAQTIIETLFELYPHESECIKWGKDEGLDLLVGSDAWRKRLLSLKQP